MHTCNTHTYTFTVGTWSVAAVGTRQVHDIVDGLYSFCWGAQEQ